MLILQNIIVIFSVLTIDYYFDLKWIYHRIMDWKTHQRPICDADGIGLDFLIFPVDDDGVHYTDILNVANEFLIVGIILAILAGVLLIKISKLKNAPKETPEDR